MDPRCKGRLLRVQTDHDIGQSFMRQFVFAELVGVFYSRRIESLLAALLSDEDPSRFRCLENRSRRFQSPQVSYRSS